MSKTADKHEEEQLVKTPFKEDPYADDDNALEPKKRRASSNFDDDEGLVPAKNLSIFQWVVVGILYVIFALLASFIIYISATWT